MSKRISAKAKFMSAALLLAAANADAATYSFAFYASDNAEDAVFVAPSDSDVRYTIRLDGELLSQYDLNTLNATSTWTSGGVRMQMEYQGKVVSFSDAIDPSTPFLSIDDGFVEIYDYIGDFMDFDFHPGASFVDSNDLPYTPFVYGQLDVYDNQKSFQDFYSLWAKGDTSVLPSYIETPVPGAAVLFSSAAVSLLMARRRRSHRVQ